MGGGKVSIRAPEKGAMRHPPRPYHPPACFNSRTREGCDIRKLLLLLTLLVSFNSRTREGCDVEYQRLYLLVAGFNSRTREGCDLLAARCPAPPRVSIRAPEKGAITYCLTLKNKKKCFNSRTREGCDLCKRWPAETKMCFNSRTREGCDMRSANTMAGKSGFQFAHPRRVRYKIKR